MSAIALGVTAKRSLSLVALLAVGVAVMAALQWGRNATPTAWVELHGRDVAALSPFLDATGADVRIDSFRGKVVVLNLWAPWCAPCLKEMPSLDRLAARLPESDFAVVAVTKDPAGDSPSRRMFDSLGLKRLRLYLDPKGQLASEIGAVGLPTTVILSQTGAPIAWTEGAADWDSPATIAKLEALAGRTKVD